MTTRGEIVAYVRSLEGMGESPVGSNINTISKAYGDPGGAWCAMTTWYVFKHFGIDFKKLYTAEWSATTAGANAAKSRGDWHAGLGGIQPGDLVYFKIPGGDAGYVNHTGIYVSAPAVTIDGNWQNKLQQVDHAASHVVGYIRVSRFVTSPPPFPGAGFFHAGASNVHVTELGNQLVKKGFGRHYKVGPGPSWGEADRLNTQDFQHAQGWTGGDADGYPGPETWRRLFA